ncbi:hypothetical protein A3H16_00010 [Candidatus Kaiserbacteria bacterium RIFCSPLOWO2_12_FULL_53_8]|uniref:Uncharacterized protein n=2 Tax=Candidatus Kaiseribacteriota TaxID=1752734 RepID=A0A1F6CVG4_9BACT|nr:MAG: hypothetical protein A2851_03640 [Candidatus Kaiserbacteria bacterium RIFCSPHIGHO2_01_FULL_53_29]OGG91345.1 MAG: hypothetical protein A3H16_00010 [Candidatus Kaiserbacteria bacterium RIFCSPLOWO2_12_FULL_53_8]
MTYDYHIVLGAIAAVGSLVGYGLYFRSIFRGITKPHPFSWLIFVVLDGTVFVAQVVSGGGPGAWVTGVSALMNALIFLLALTRGEKRIAKVDWVCLACAFFGIVLWWITDQPLLGVVFAAAADAIAKVPTLRKSYLRPDEESITLWSLDILKFSLSIAALSSVTLTTALFPAEAVVTNGLLVILILLRRRQLDRIPKS